MTQTPTRPTSQDTPDGGGGGRRGTASPYLEILRIPGALAFSSTAFIARMPMAMFGLGTVLLIAAVTGRYGLAGVIGAAGSVGYAVAAPQTGRLADRFGQRRVLRPQAAVFAGATVALMVTAEARAPLPVVAVAGVLAGGTMPSAGSMVRARWSALLAGTDRLHTAFSLESVVDEIIFVVGPVLATLLATSVYPAAGVGAAMLLGVTGTMLLTAQRSTEPATRPYARRAKAAGRQPVGAGAQAGPGAGPGAAAGRLASAGLLTLLGIYTLMGAMFSAIELSTVAFAGEHGHKALAGVLLGMYAAGSGVGGLWYGSRHWRAPVGHRFAVTMAVMTAGVATFWLQPGLLTLAAVIMFAGLAIAPTLIGGVTLIERLAPPGRRTEAMTWLSSSIAVGAAVGAPLAGHLIDTHGARSGYALAACCGALALTVCLTGLRQLR